MRLRFKPAFAQRSELRARLARIRQPAAVREILRAGLPPDLTPAEVVCTVQSVHSDRFVVRAQVRNPAREEHGFALKVYSDISFYHGLTLIRKIDTVCRSQPAEWPALVPQLAARARAALEEIAAPVLIG